LLTASPAAGALSGCAASRIQEDPIARLEAQSAARPGAASTHRALGVAYYKNDRIADARRELAEAARLDPRDGVTALYLGLTAEAQDDLPAARAAYSSYMKVGRTRSVRSQLETRLAALQRREIADAAKLAVAREREIGASDPPTRSVAVLPFSFVGSDTTYRPLERGFAELVAADLARIPELTVVERIRVQAILDEIALQQSGSTDAASAVRAGRLTQAGSLVSGQLAMTGNQIRATPAVISVRTSEVQSTGSPAAMSIDQLFDLQDQVVFGIVEHFGIRLTTAQRNAITMRPTRSLQAFLAYSRGLTAEEHGSFDDAARFYQDASRIDPGFSRAEQKTQAMRNLIAGAQVSPSNVEAGLKGSAEGVVVDAAARGVAVDASLPGMAQSTAASLNPSVAGVITGSPVVGGPPVPSGPEAGSATGADNPMLLIARLVFLIPR
jgi:TolB-like protein